MLAAMCGCLLIGSGALPDVRNDDGEWAELNAAAEREEALRKRIAAVNEGDLQFLTGAMPADLHQHSNRIVISDSSLHDGWVSLEQCHRNLDRVAAAQIMFHPERTRDLRVLSFHRIDDAFTERGSVQLRGIHAASEVCISAQMRALLQLDGGVFELHNGPFMRRFLDGFYPLHLTMHIDYPATLTLADYAPAEQPGFHVRQKTGQLDVEALFEGKLQTNFRFWGE